MTDCASSESRDDDSSFGDSDSEEDATTHSAHEAEEVG